jgi:magnesium chelatase family protein
VPQEELLAQAPGESSGAVRARVGAARERQLARQGKANVELGTREVERHCRTDAAGTTLLKAAIARLGLSARAYHRVLKLARTIADLAGAEAIAAGHVAEAIGFRRGLETTP